MTVRMQRRNVRRRNDLHAQVTMVVRMTRETLGWTQRKLASRADCSPSTISRLESGQLTDVSVRTIGRLFDALGVRAEIRTAAPFLADPPGQRDAAHARCSASTRRRLEAMGWIVAQEVEIVAGSARGWIDVLAYRPGTRDLLLIEVKTEIRDLGAIRRSLAWYEREAFDAGRSLGWRPTRLVSALLLLETPANDVAIKANRELLRQWLPTRATTLASWLADPTGRTPGRGLAMIDPASHRRAWLRPTRVDGRRSPARYASYAAFMLQARSRDH
jgi:transcriptional regulator with XRE-family HTH domain